MRKDGRKLDQMRDIKVDVEYLEYPAGSCLVTLGKTRVLCAVSVENHVPSFLLGQGRGWLTAEYSLLPCSTQERIQREANIGKLSGRTQEIRRFIGRSLRPIFDLSLVGEKTFIIDCDVIQADGGTRTAAVNGAFIALASAVNKMEFVLDLSYEEDSSAEIDMNLVMTGRGKIIEVQATAEKVPVSRSEFDKLIELGSNGIRQIVELEKKLLGNIGN